MRRTILLLLASLCAQATVTRQYLFGTVGTGAMSASATQYLAVALCDACGPVTNVSQAYVIWPNAPGTLAFVINLQNAPGTGATAQFNLYVNGSASVTSTCSIAGNSATACGATNSCTLTTCGLTPATHLNQHDLVAIQWVPTSSPATNVGPSIGFVFIPDTPNQIVLMNGGDATASLANRFQSITSQGSSNGGRAAAPMVMPIAGTITSITGGISATLTAGNTVTYTLEKGAAGVTPSATALTVGCGNGSANTYCDFSTNITASPGDLFDIAQTRTGSPNVYMYDSMVMVPTTPGQFPIITNCQGSLTGGTNYMSPGRSNYGNETQMQSPIPGVMKVTAIYVWLSAALGSGNTFTVSTEVGSGPSSPVLSVALANVATGNASATVIFTFGQLVNFKTVPTGSSFVTVTPATFSWAGFVPPVDSHFFSVMQ